MNDRSCLLGVLVRIMLYRSSMNHTGLWILGNQLDPDLGVSTSVPVLMIESKQWVRQIPYHKQKIVLVWSAMRHFAQHLRDQGYRVTYIQSEDFQSTVAQFIQTEHLTTLQLMEPADWPLKQGIQSWELPIEFTPDRHFLWSISEFFDWANQRTRLVLEDFYRLTRQRFTILIDQGQPVGGQWNFDPENRRPPKKGLNPPLAPQFPPDDLTRQVITEVETYFPEHFGTTDTFNWGVTRADALRALEDFCTYRLAGFGPYQDIMLTDEATLWHSLISPYLNLGLLRPLEVIERAVAQPGVPLNSLEGFVRQILGWREYIRGVYWLKMPNYAQSNYFDHHQPLPDFFWTGQTSMHCLHDVIQQIQTTAYAHHIQRLMILGNFMLISGIDPQAGEVWFHAATVDAYDWVMQTNALGMALFADGGVLATKPYAASANYINKMSNYCADCTFDPKIKFGPRACPFNYFYWDFLLRNQTQLIRQGRMGLVLKHLEKFTPDEIQIIHDQAIQFWHFQEFYKR